MCRVHHLKWVCRQTAPLVQSDTCCNTQFRWGHLGQTSHILTVITSLTSRDLVALWICTLKSNDKENHKGLLSTLFVCIVFAIRLIFQLDIYGFFAIVPHNSWEINIIIMLTLQRNHLQYLDNVKVNIRWTLSNSNLTRSAHNISCKVNFLGHPS